MSFKRPTDLHRNSGNIPPNDEWLTCVVTASNDTLSKPDNFTPPMQASLL